jgi:hypothetical protein
MIPDWHLLKGPKKLDKFLAKLPIGTVFKSLRSVGAAFTSRGHRGDVEIFTLNSVPVLKIVTARNRAHADVWFNVTVQKLPMVLYSDAACAHVTKTQHDQAKPETKESVLEGLRLAEGI